MEVPRIQARIPGGLHVRCARTRLPSIRPGSNEAPTRYIRKPTPRPSEQEPNPPIVLTSMALPPRPLPRQPPRARPPSLPPTHNPPSVLHLLPTPNPPRPQRPNPPPLPLPAPNIPLPLPLLAPQTPPSHLLLPIPIPHHLLPHPPFPTSLTPPPTPHTPHNPPLRRPNPQHPHRLNRLLPLRRRLHHPPPRQQHHPHTHMSAFSILPAAGASWGHECAYRACGGG